MLFDPSSLFWNAHPASAERLREKRQLIINRCRVATVLLTAALTLCVGCATVPPAGAPLPTPPPTSAQAGATTIVAVAAPAAPGMTLPKFLGLDVLYGGARLVGQRVRNRLGTRFPGLESKPPLRSISDPANLGPDASPAEKAAAEAKAEEDKAPQKAKAISYLASRGCGECYPDTADAMIAALDDCSEEIRYAAVKGLRSSVGDSCQSCRENSCCTPKLLRKLYEVAYERDDSGCFLESSARVRRNARLVICTCGGVPQEEILTAPFEGPSSGDVVPLPVEGVPPPVEATASKSGSADSAEETADETAGDSSRSILQARDSEDSPATNPIAVVGLVTDADSKENQSATVAGFVLPDSFDPTLESDDDSVRRE